MIKTILLVVCLLGMVPVTTHGAFIPKCGSYQTELEKYDWDVRIADSIMYHESGCKPWQVNARDSHRTCKGSFSLMQVACLHYKKGQSRTDGVINIKIAYRVYQEAGNSFRPWTTCKKVKGCK